MLEKPPPEGKRVTATSSSFLTSAPGGRKVAPAVVRKGHVAGKSGEKIAPVGPRQPLGEASPIGPATPESPEETTIETPCMPSFMNSAHWRRWYEAGRSASWPP